MRWMTIWTVTCLMAIAGTALASDAVQQAASTNRVVLAGCECAAPAPVAPGCCAPAPQAPTCCAPAPAAPSCCAPAAPSCGAPAAPSCCAPAAPACCAPAPRTCCQSNGCCCKKSCGAHRHCGGCRLFGKSRKCDCECCGQQRSASMFDRVMELERRKNEWIVETFIERF